MNLADLKTGESGRIAAIESAGPLKRRLMDMGVLSGEKVKVIKLAPLGDPIEIMIKNYRLSLRRTDARKIVLEDRHESA